MSREYGNHILHNEDGLIITHHNLPLHCLDAKAGASKLTINCILDSRSEIVTIPKQVGKAGVTYCICFDHTMTMASTNTNTDVTLGVLENLALNLRSGKVCLQVQVLARTNFDFLLGRPFHCLMSATTDDFPDRGQNITLCNPNSKKEYKLPTRPWRKGCSHCQKDIKCSNHQSIVEMGF